MREAISEVTTQTATDCLRESADPGIIIVNGYGIRIVVRSGELIVIDGVRSGERVRKISRTDRHIKRLFILSASGIISLEAVRWCADLGITLAQVDRDGNALLTSPGVATADARLRIQQVYGQDSPIAVSIMRQLVAAKIAGQASNAEKILRNDVAANRIQMMAKKVAMSNDMTEVLACEGQAALVYWQDAWKDRVFMPWHPGQLSTVRPHWFSFKNRASLHNPARQGQHSTDPINSMLNYAYAVAETEARIACQSYGLDPAIGFSHGEHKKADSLSFDLQEPLRPLADQIVLSMLDTGLGPPLDPDTGKPHYFYARNFIETSQGVCRICEPLTNILSSRVSLMVAREASRWAETIARQLAQQSRWNLNVKSHVTDPAVMRAPKRPRMTLSDSLTITDLVPDSLWKQIEPLIPAPVRRPDKRYQTPRADNRTCLAAIVAHETHGVAWKSIPASWGISWATPSRRLTEWRQQGAWPKIAVILGVS